MPATTSNLTTFSNIARSGSLANYDWTSPSNAQTNNNTSALIDAVPDTSRTASGEGYIDFLQGKQLVTTVPTTASITGLSVRIRRDGGDSVWDGSSGVAVTDQVITLIHTAPDGITRVIGDNKSTGALWNTGTLQYYTVGGTDDTWNVGGLGLTAWLVNDSGFGISISPYIKYNILGQQRIGPPEIVQFLDPTPLVGLYGQNSKIDHVEVSVFYLASNITFDGGSAIGITTGQILSVIHRLSASNRIQHIGKASEQTVGSHRLSYNTYSIKPSALNTAQAISNVNRLSAVARIRVTGQNSDQNVGNTRLSILPYRILHSSILTGQNLSNSNLLYASANIRPNGLSSVDSFGLQKLQAVATIRPGSVISTENFGLNRLYAIAAIRPSSISTFESLSNLRLFATANILAESLRTVQNTGQTRLASIANIRPTSTPSAQTLGNHLISNITGIRPSGLLTQQVVNTPSLTTRSRVFTSGIISPATVSNAHYLYNYFYENLNGLSNSFYAGDFSTYFGWDSTYNLPFTAQNGKSVRRLSVADGSTPGNRVAVYPAGYFRGSSFYYSGYIKINTSGGLSGLGFGIDSVTSSNGYFVLLSANNTAGSPSIQIRRNLNGSNIASFNRTGLINTTDWYRIIITWDANGLITANVYNSLGSTLVASVSVTDTTYPYGFIGVSAFDDSAFDNLTNIVASFINNVTGVISAEAVSQSHRLIVGGATINVVNRGIQAPNFSGVHRLSSPFVIRSVGITTAQLLGSHTLNVSYKVYPLSVTTAQILGSHTLSPGAVRINATGLTTSDNFGLHRLNSLNIIFPSGLNTDQNFGSHILIPGSVNIYHLSILTAQTVSSNRLLLVGSEILASGVRSAENFGQHVLIPGKVNILHASLSTAQSLGLHRVNAANYIYPVSTPSGEIIGSHLLRSNVNIRPDGLLTAETIGLHRLESLGVRINPSGLTTAQAIGLHRLSSRNYIYPGGTPTGQIIGSHLLNVRARILHSSVSTAQAIGTHRLVPGNANIFASGTSSIENIGLHRLTGAILIRPASLNTSEIIGSHLLRSVAFIRPAGAVTAEVLGLHRLSTITFIYPSSTNSSTLITNLHRLAVRNYIYPGGTPTGQIIGSHLLNTASSITPAGLPTIETIGLHRLQSLGVTINPSGLTTAEAIGLHRLSSINYIYPGGITTVQTIGSHTLVANAYIRPIGILTRQTIGDHRLSGIVLITPTNIDATPLPELHRLVVPSYNIYPSGTVTVQNIGLHRLASMSYIRPEFLPSREIIGSHRLSLDRYNIYHVSITSDQTLGLHRLDTSSSIRPSGIITEQRIGLHRLVYGAATIYASGVDTFERIGLHRLAPGKVFIYHISPFDKPEIGWSDGAHGVYLTFDEFIYVNNHAPGQPGYYPMNAPEIGEIHRLNVENYNIFASSMPTVENPLGNHRLSFLASIQAITISSEETLGLHKLNAVAYIRPSAKTTEEAIGSHKLDVNYNIYPMGQPSKSFVGNNRVSVILGPLEGSNTGTEILLSENGTDLYTWSSAVFPQVEVILNSNILPGSAYQLLPNSGKIVFNSIVISGTDTLVVKLYTFILSNVPKLEFEAFIYVSSIQTRQRLGRHKLKLQTTPGFIDSYFELLQTIEVDIQ